MPKPHAKPEKMTALTIRLDAATARDLAILTTPAGGFVGAPISAIIRALIRDRAAAITTPIPTGSTHNPTPRGRA